VSANPASPQASAPAAPSTNLPDLLTISAIAIIDYALADFIHEGIGHGGMCLLIGGHPTMLSSVSFECVRLVAGSSSEVARSLAVGGLVPAGGTLANLAAGMLCWLGLRFVSRATRLRYFLWVLMIVNLMEAAGYFLFSGIANTGDWAEVIASLQPAWLWRLGLTVLGIVLYLAFVVLALYEIRPFLGSSRPERLRRARRLTFTAYFSGCIFVCISSLFNPKLLLVLISGAASSFGGTSGFLWMGSWLRGPWFPTSSLQMPPLTRSWAWIVAAAVVAIVFIAILGPGIHFHRAVHHS
jgi:hypothetical protein